MSLVADYNSDSSLSEEDTKVEEPVAEKASLHSTLKSKRGGPVKIVVDLPKHDHDIEEEIEPKRQKLNRSNSSLSAILPSPKRSIKSVKKDNKKSDTNKPAGITDFVPHTVNKPKLATIEKKLKIDEHTNEYIDYYGTNTNDQEYFNNESCQYNQESEQIQSNWEPDEEVIKEINAADQMAGAWQSQITDISKPTKGSTYQANAMENDLKEQHATNKKTKRETQAKYVEDIW
ncbi:8424_t:CDS:2 [Diversispora eburnea]|uniref:8424_t:CDS:1 n=1 Tax=Diversispora eburnea TaxID=1213867 RepID=A0A9N8W691_9GLOM|nr:8424_t:CDS:2 [Diversispora eburnea]